MLKKKIALLLSVLSAFVIVGCGGETANGGGDTPNSNVQQSSTPDTSNPETPQLTAMDGLFNGVKVGYEKDTLSDINGASITFEQAVDRQFSVLSEDILYRLYLTYGYRTYGEQSDFQDLTLHKGAFSDGTNTAKVKKSTTITDLTAHDTSVYYHNREYLDCAYCYQQVVNGENTHLNNVSCIIFAKAITGHYMSYDGRDLVNEPIAGKAWIFSDYTQWYTTYLDSFKYSLAKIAYGEENTSLTYEEILSRLTVGGFDGNAEEKVVSYIYNNVIGVNLVNEDLRIYNTFSAQEKGSLVNFSEVEKHFYKGYNIVIPAIVKQAFGNTFENAQTSLYPTFMRNGVNVASSYTVSVYEKNSEIVLMPKQELDLTKIIIEITGTKNEEITLSYDVVNGGVKTTKSQKISLSTTAQTVELEVGTAIGAYNGNTNAYTNVNVFGNSDVADYHGDNYVAFQLDGVETSFTVAFKGVYTK